MRLLLFGLFLSLGFLTGVMATPVLAVETADRGSAALTRSFAVAEVPALVRIWKRPMEPGDADRWSQDFLGRYSAADFAGRDVIVYVHGFRTEFSALVAQSRVIHDDISGLEPYRTQLPPLFIHFSWPGQYLPMRFGAAQRSAFRSAQFLEALLVDLAPQPQRGRLILMAHSLGTLVAMEALSMAQRNGWKGQITDALVLVQGAIPAVSIRSWSSEIETRFPSLEIASMVDDDIDWPEPLLNEYHAGFGSYYASSKLAGQMIVTTARGDGVLGAAYAMKEWHFPFASQGPEMMPQTRFFPRDHALAIGTPFPENPVFDVWPPIMNPMMDHSLDPLDSPAQLELMPDPSEVLEQHTVRYEFAIGHPNYEHIELGSLLRHANWHSPFNDIDSRGPVLKAIWSILDD